MTENRDVETLKTGQRVSRIDSEELGTVVEADGEIKVKWDSGRTSYFHRGERVNVRLSDLEK